MSDEKTESSKPVELSAEDRELYSDFGQECEIKIDELESLLFQLEDTPDDTEIPKSMYRILHTVKGTAASVGLTELAHFAHKYEDYVVPIREGVILTGADQVSVMLKATETLRGAIQTLKNGERPQIEQDKQKIFSVEAKVASAAKAEAGSGLHPSAKKNGSGAESSPANAGAGAGAKIRKISIELDAIDEVLARSGNITVARDFLAQELETLSSRYPDEDLLKSSLTYLSEMGKENDLLQRHMSQLRKTPVAGALRAPQRAVRDLSIQLGKKVKLDLVGTNVQVDCDVSQILSDSMVHLVRNALDHGLEFPDERIKANKAAEARISIQVTKQSEELEIRVADDGRGIDPEKIKRKAIERNLTTVERAANLSEEAILGFLFESGFSTAEKVTEVSGRGVGLDMVMKSLASIKGRVRIRSALGRGTEFILTIPERKSTNILNSFIVEMDGHRMAIPCDQIQDVKSIRQLKNDLRLYRRDKTLYVEEQQTFREAIERLQVQPLGTQVGAAHSSEGHARPSEDGYIFFLNDSGVSAAICVNEIYRIDKVIIKDLDLDLHKAGLFEKAAISGRFGLLLYFDLEVAKKWLLKNDQLQVGRSA